VCGPSVETSPPLVSATLPSRSAPTERRLGSVAA